MIPALVFKDEDEGQQVDGERGDPEERNYRYVLWDEIRRREEQRGAGGGEADPKSDGGERWGRRFGLSIGSGRRRRVEAPCGPTADDREGDVQDRPQAGLSLQAKKGLDGKRVGQQRQEGPEVRKGIEAPGRLIGMAQVEPALQQGSGCGEQEVGATDGESQDGEYRERRVGGGGGISHREARGERQKDEGRGEKRDVYPGLQAGIGAGPEPVGVGVAADQQDLKEKHAGSPDLRASTVPRQDEAAHDGLDLEEKEGSQEDADQERGVGHRGATISCVGGGRMKSERVRHNIWVWF